MSIDENEKEKDEPEPKVDLNPLAPGVWITEATGFASVPPRAQSDLSDVRCDNEKAKNDEAKNDAVKKDDVMKEKAAPRIEDYPER
jgi:hypothetical protein